MNILEERREQAIKAIQLAYETAAFNGENIVFSYRHPGGDECYRPDYLSLSGSGIGRYVFESSTLTGGKKRIWIDKNSSGNYYCTMDINKDKNIERYELDKILEDEELFNQLLVCLNEPLTRYHFQAEDIINGNVYTLKPQNSMVADHIEAFLFRFANALRKGIPAECKVWKTYGAGSNLTKEKVTIRYEKSKYSNYSTTFTNHLLAGHTETKSISFGEVLDVIDLKSIANQPLEKEIKIKDDYILCQFIQTFTPDLLAKWTRGLNEKATMEDLCDVIKFFATFNYTLSEDYIYDPDNSFTPEIRQRINELNNKLEDRGTVFGNNSSSNLKRS